MQKSSSGPLQPPKRTPDISDIAYSALRLSALYARLALEERTLVNHTTGRPENVAEHSAMIAIIAPAIAEQYYPELDANLVSRFAAVHDAVEAYSGDTTTHEITATEVEQKAHREALALRQLREDFAEMPKFVSLIDQYEAQVTPEARFVRVIDKWAPILLHFADQGATLRSYTNPEDLLANYAPRAAHLKQMFPDFVELVVVREELTELASKSLF